VGPHRLDGTSRSVERDQMDIESLALELGYGDRETFSRAFKRWTVDRRAARRRFIS
jgi:AraC-like DNA-binding protein